MTSTHKERMREIKERNAQMKVEIFQYAMRKALRIATFI